MSGDCLSFQAIPHVSELFRDYLYHFEKVQRFYESSPHDGAALLNGARQLRTQAKFPDRVPDILERQNRAFAASPATFTNIQRLRDGAVAAVSGQQVGLLGGPLYSTLKAVSAIRYARDLSAQGVDCVPVFWMATEDHDLAEVNHVTLLNLDGFPEPVQTPSAAGKDSPVSEVRFGREIIPVVAHACELLGDTEVAAAVRDSYRPGESLGTAFAKLFARLFAEFGLVLLDPSDGDLHAVAAPMYRRAIEESEALNAALLQRGRELREAGYHEQVKVTPESTLLFEKRDGARTVIRRANGGFSVGRDSVSREELLRQIADSPHKFSPNVLLRPVVQDYLLPTAAYFAGPAEIAYFAQLEVVHRRLLGRSTPVLPRCAATLFDARAQRLMSKYGLALQDLLAGSDALRARIASKLLPTQVAGRFDETSAIATNVFRRLTGDVEKLDSTLTRSGLRAERRVLYELERLRRRAANAELRKNAEIGKHVEWLSANLFPNKGLQEREIAGVSFLARYGGLIEQLVEACGGCPGHQIVNL